VQPFHTTWKEKETIDNLQKSPYRSPGKGDISVYQRRKNDGQGAEMWV